MLHALIIDDNMIVSHAIENRLIAVGFDSFDRAWARHQAVEAVAQRTPALIVVGDSISDGSPIEVARELSLSCDAPVLMVTSGRVSLERRLPVGTQVEGPFHLVDIEAALDATGVVACKMESCV